MTRRTIRRSALVAALTALLTMVGGAAPGHAFGAPVPLSTPPWCC